MITLFLACFVLEMGSEPSHRALHSSTSHSRLQLRACSRLVWAAELAWRLSVHLVTVYNCPQSSAAVWAADEKFGRLRLGPPGLLGGGSRLRDGADEENWSSFSPGMQVTGNMLMIFLIPNMNRYRRYSLTSFNDRGNSQIFKIL